MSALSDTLNGVSVANHNVFPTNWGISFVMDFLNIFISELNVILL